MHYCVNQDSSLRGGIAAQTKVRRCEERFLRRGNPVFQFSLKILLYATMPAR